MRGATKLAEVFLAEGAAKSIQAVPPGTGARAHAVALASQLSQSPDALAQYTEAIDALGFKAVFKLRTAALNAFLVEFPKFVADLGLQSRTTPQQQRHHPHPQQQQHQTPTATRAKAAAGHGSSKKEPKSSLDEFGGSESADTSSKTASTQTCKNATSNGMVFGAQTRTPAAPSALSATPTGKYSRASATSDESSGSSGSSSGSECSSLAAADDTPPWGAAATPAQDTAAGLNNPLIILNKSGHGAGAGVVTAPYYDVSEGSASSGGSGSSAGSSFADERSSATSTTAHICGDASATAMSTTADDSFSGGTSTSAGTGTGSTAAAKTRHHHQHKYDEDAAVAASASWLIDESEIEMGGIVGAGQSALIHEATWRGQRVAVKFMKQKADPKTMKNFQRECQLLMSVRTPQIVFFYGAVVIDSSLCLILEYCARGSLEDFMKEHARQFTWERFFTFSRQATEGLLSLHKWKPAIVHRDFKGQNLLVCFDLADINTHAKTRTHKTRGRCWLCIERNS